MESETMCLRDNPAEGRRYWACSLPRGHAGAHRAHASHDPAQEYEAWPNDPAPIDPVLVTLAAAFIAARLPHEPSEDAIRHGISDALATRAALREAGDHNQNGDDNAR